MKLSKDKLYYSISEVAAILGIKQSTIRYWEKEFVVLRPFQKAKNKKKKYKVKDIQLLDTIKRLLHEEKFTIKGANQQLKTWKPEQTADEFIALVNEGVKEPVQEQLFPLYLEQTKTPINEGYLLAHSDKVKIFKKIEEIHRLLKRIR